ncbi:MAG TPA: ABC transporter substrate-binding protein [Cellulomonas sp.]
MTRRRATAWAAGLALVAGLGACSSGGADDPATTPGSDGPTTVTFAQGDSVSNLDPYAGGNTTTATLLFHLFDALTSTDDEGVVHGELAESYEAVDDTTWELKLRQGVVFHDGEPFDADAVEYSIDRLLDPEKAFTNAADFQFISDVEVVDEYTVRIHTDAPFAGFPLRMIYLPMVPPDYIEEHGDEYFNEHPVGTGPFSFVEWVKDDRIVLQANEDYWGGAPEIDELIYRTIPDPASRIAALQAGEVDLISSVPTSQLASLGQLDGIETVASPTTRAMYVGMNINRDAIAQDKDFRQALNYAVDVDTIIDTVLQGNGTRLATLVTPELFGYDDSIEPYPYDPDQAEKLLAESAYAGEEIRLSVSPGSFVNGKEVAEAIAGYLRDVGVDVVVQDVENTVMSSSLKDGSVSTLYFHGVGGPYASAELTSRIRFGTGQRSSAYSNPELDALIAAGAQELDEAAAEQIWSQMQELEKEEAPAIWLYQQYGTYAYSSDLVDWKPRLDELILFEGARLER